MTQSAQSIDIGTRVRERHPVFYAPVATGDVIDANDTTITVRWGGSYSGVQVIERTRVGMGQTDLVCIDTGLPRNQRNDASEQRRCDQCGREGIRGFKVIPSDHVGPTDGVESFTVCASEAACRRRRREAPYPDEY